MAQEIEEVVFVTLVRYPNGTTSRVVTLFETLPEWAKTLVNPIWDHEPHCECITCWEIVELGR